MKRILIFLIRIYQRVVSPYSKGKCRFIPTCSQYAVQAIERHGSIYGSYLALKRILKCNPFGPYGYDPVPEKESKPKV